LAREKAHTREGDAIAAARRRLPMVEVDPTIKVIDADGPIEMDAVTVTGGPGDDAVVPGFAPDDTTGRVETAVGGDGSDQMVGGGGRDNFSGGAGDDRLFGAGGDDTMLGGPVADVAAPSSTTTDPLYLENGDDRIAGGPGDDSLDAGPGSDLVDARPSPTRAATPRRHATAS
jgi:Ca2+-binding RTX toxin-like protein